MNESEGQKPTHDQAEANQPAPPAPVEQSQPAPDHEQRQIPAPQMDAEHLKQENTEQQVSLEKNAEAARELTTPSVGRLLASLENKDALHGTEFEEQKAEAIADTAAQQSPDNLPSQKIAELSYNVRKKRWEDDDRELKDKAAEWRKKLGTWIIKKTDPNKEGSEPLLATISSVGIDTDNLDQSLEAFREKYVNGKESNVEQFAKDLAEGCRVDGKINLEKLKKQLDAAKDLFRIFGTDNNVHDLVHDYAAAHAVLSEAKDNEQIRSTVKERVKEHLQHEITDPAVKSRLELLYSQDTQEHENIGEKEDSQETNKSKENEDSSSTSEEETSISNTEPTEQSEEQQALEDFKSHLLTHSRIQEIAQELNDFIEKSKQGQIMPEDKARIKPLISEYLSGMRSFTEEEYRENLSKFIPEKDIESIINNITTLYQGKHPEEYVIQYTLDENRNIIPDPLNPNLNIPQLRTNPDLSEVMDELEQEMKQQASAS